MKTLKVANGKVQGQVKNILGNDVVQFLSIPYCKPPVNELRFRKPQPCDTFIDQIINKLDFETFPPQSPLPEIKFDIKKESLWHPKGRPDEDCLYVNVWCPLNILEGNEKKPVLINIYGGGFIYGSSSVDLFSGAILASQENIIVVTLNYRVAVLGFLCLDEEEMNGNLGIWDQGCALRWIHENISVFNGDPSNITISGNSAGGASVTSHLFIEENWSYFNKAIPMSGTCLSDWAIHSKEQIMRRSMTAVNKILHKFHSKLKWDLNTPKKDKMEIVQFLQTLNFNEFLNDFEVVKGFIQLGWAPYVDGELIKDIPRHLLRKGQFKKCPIMFLNSENEGCMLTYIEYSDIKKDNDNVIDMDYFNKIMDYYPYFPKKCTDSIKDKVKKEYNIEDKLSMDVLDKIAGDKTVICDIIEMANLISELNKEVYYLWHRTNTNNTAYDLPKMKDATHASELYFYFGIPFRNDKIPDKTDQEISKIFMANFGQFIKFGHLRNGLPYYSKQSKSFIAIEGTDWHEEHFTEDWYRKVKFWTNLRETCNSS